MLSDRITTLFHILQCSNTDIARFAGCSPSNISRLKSGTRELGPESRSVQRLAEGIYQYADYENLLPVLVELLKTNDTRAKSMIPAILTWLYEESDFTPPRMVTPKSKIVRDSRRRKFGERLDKVMTLLDLSNTQVAQALNVDVSLVSRYRSGIYHPDRNERIKSRLSEKLLTQAEKAGLSGELADLCGTSDAELTVELLADWLYETDTERTAEMAETFFQTIDTFTSSQASSFEWSKLPPVTKLNRYWGTPGLRAAMIRFLTNTAREGGEILLYSDEPMEYVTGDDDYFSLWSFLVKECVRNNVHIKIIHHVDRIGKEMIFAIKGWFPLYVSNMIEPYIFRNVKNPRFFHTIFIRPGKEAVVGAFPAKVGENRWYDYITDRERLGAVENSYHAMLAGATPFLKTYPAEKSEDFWQICMKHYPRKWYSILSGLSIGTMPRKLLLQILDRSEVTDSLRERILQIHDVRRHQLRITLDAGSIVEIFCLPSPDAVRQGTVIVNLGAEMLPQALTYTPEEYAEHLEAIRKLIDHEKNYHLTLLPEAPFRDLQVFILRGAVAVLRCREPYTAFVFFNSALSRSVSDYMNSLVQQYAKDRFTVSETLKELIAESTRSNAKHDSPDNTSTQELTHEF